MTEVRIVRLGFRSRTVPVPASAPASDTLRVAMMRLPTMLETVKVTAGAKCDERTNAGGQALLQQARAGLLATIVGREAYPAKFVRLSYERTFSARLDTMAPTVRIDSVNESKTTFRAARRGIDLVRRGFTADSFGTGVYFGPDAEVLLDEGFEAGYCFYVVPERRGLIGLGFSPAASRRIGRVDVDGVLWIDTKERALRLLEYRYLGLGADAERNGVGGSLTYQEMPNGTVIASRWTLRLLKVRVDSVMQRFASLPMSRIVASEGGGMVARAEWPDGTKWEAPLGALHVTAVDGETGRRLPGAEVRLRNTNFVSIADENGVARFANVFPGRYAVDVSNRELDNLGFVSANSLANANPLDSTVIRQSQVMSDTSNTQMQRTVDVFGERTARHVAPMQTMRQFAASACRDRRGGSASRRAILGRVVYGNGRGADSVVVKANDLGRRLTSRIGGAFVLCVPDDWAGPVKLRAEDGPMRSEEVVLDLGAGVTTARLVLRP